MTQNVHIRLASQRIDNTIVGTSEVPRLYTPGEIITCRSGFMRGHGTYMEEDALTASVAGVVEQVNKLISVRPIKNRYNGEIGDVVVGRITEVQQKRWKVDTNSRLDSVLLLSSVNLPGGELRRRGTEDEQMMRKYLQEGDLISAEVQKIYDDGSLSLYTRSLKYGKLCQGVLVKVFPSLVKRRKTHFHNLPCGASMILGNNGFIWICPTVSEDEENGLGGFTENLLEVVPRTDREVIARLRNCILALANCKMMLCDTSILYAFEESQKYEVLELLRPEPMLDVCVLTQQRLYMQEDE
ncbi:Exosome complex component RRP4 [Cryptotermes secundus]|uniref:Exosome complex component RRP4 n=1 Tax=Cryptotermes secundus TaxID=105785 RepID=A0A2J7RGE7_9NEOP|nr:exosome complex component RRP4 [Cryptotermes secundus]PNF39909.1 Exosome complex component RRP4 [Cryptotermes secundus]PNF39910.1 Exosome complex component RRP4 [Cryptotermes secundus]